MDTLTLALAFCLNAAALTPAEDVAYDQVDLVEVNHFFDEHGKRVFDQVIFYDWSPGTSRFQVRAWRLLKSQGQYPVKNWSRGDWSAVWHDGEVLREVRAASFRETWTQYDPELVERDYLPKEKRRDFVKPEWVKTPPRRTEPARETPPPERITPSVGSQASAASER